MIKQESEVTWYAWVSNWTGLFAIGTTVFVLQFRRIDPTDLDSNKLIQTLIPIVLLSVSVCMAFAVTRSSKGTKRLSEQTFSNCFAVSALLLAFGVSVITTVPIAGYESQLWNGFGRKVFALNVLVVFVIISFRFKLIQLWQSSWRVFTLRASNLLASLVLIAVYLPTLLQPPGGIINIADTTYFFLDETLAQLSGQFPNATYLPTYTSMFGWLIWPLQYFHLSPTSIMAAGIAMINILIIAIPLMIVFTVRKFERQIPFAIALLFVVALIAVSGPINAASTTFSNMAVMPGRFFLPFAGILVASSAMLKQDSTKRITFFALSGVLTSITGFNNPDVCLAFVVAICSSYGIGLLTKSIRNKDILAFMTGLISFTVLYLCLAKVLTKGFSFKMYGYFSTTRVADFYFNPMPVKGPHLIVFSVTAAVITLGVIKVTRQSGTTETTRRREQALGIVSLISGFWTILLLFRFSMGPVIPFGVQGLLLPTTLNLLLTSIMILPKNTRELLPRDRTLTEFQSGYKTNRFPISTLPLIFLLLLPFASILQAPFPPDEWKRVLGEGRKEGWSTSPSRPASDGWTPEILRNEGTQNYPIPWLLAIERYAHDYPGKKESLGYFGVFGNTVQLITGVENVLGVSAPEMLRFNGWFSEKACAPIIRLKPTQIIVFGSEMPCKGANFIGSDESGLLKIYAMDERNS